MPEILLDILLHDFLGKPVWAWSLFIGVVTTLIVLDLGVLHRGNREIGIRESLWLSAGYFGIACLFGLWVWGEMGPQSGQEYFIAFLVEKSLAMDNVFVISLIFTFFAVPRHLQHRVLFWGILGVVVLRAIMIGLGAALISLFSWILYLFGAFLLFTGVKMLMVADHMPNIEDNAVLKFLRRHLRVTDSFHGQKFLVRLPDPKREGQSAVFVTPLFLALILIECADLVFAVDSIPAVFAVTQDAYIVYTSNIFAILGLRALYFALAAMVHRFAYLKHALSLILIFIGTKIFAAALGWHVPAAVSLGVTVLLLGGGVAVSLWRTRRPVPQAAE